MTEPHTDCPVCAYWQARLSEEKARTLAGCEGAFAEERRVRAELQEHLAREEAVA